MKKLSKILILVLSVALICCGLVIAVSADSNTPGASWTDANGEVQTAETLSAAIAAAPADATVTLTGDTVDAQISITKNVTIDLNGYTLTSNKDLLFSIGAAVDFEVIGEGAIVVDGMLLNASAGTVANASIVGSGAGIDITHTGVSNNYLVVFSNGQVTVKNADITAIPNKGHVFSVRDDAAANGTLNVIGCNVDTTGTGESSDNVATNSGIFQVGKAAHINVSYSTLNTTGCAFDLKGQSAKYDNYITIEGSYIKASNKSVNTGIFGAYTTIYSDVVIKDSHLEGSFRTIMVNETKNGAAFILDNTTLAQNGVKQGDFIRTANVKMINGSKLIAYGTGVTTMMADSYDSSKDSITGWTALSESGKMYFYLYEGARFDANVYKLFSSVTPKTIKDATRYQEDYFRFVEIADDGTESYVLPSDATKLTIVYDPVGCPEAPYVVAPITETAPAIFNKAEDGTRTLNTIGTLSSAPTIENVVFSNTTGKNRSTYNTSNLSFGTTLLNGNTVFRHQLNGKTNASAPCFIFGLGNNNGNTKSYINKVSAATIDMLIYDFDIAASTDGGFIPGNIKLHNRGTATDGTDEVVSILNLSQSGVITPTTAVLEKGVDYYQLSIKEWNHVTIVMETKSNTGSAFVFINGTYIGRFNSWYDRSGDGMTYYYGPRYDTLVKNGHALASNTELDIVFDNMVTRSYGTGTFEYSPMTSDKASEYLINGGKAWSTGTVDFKNLTAGNIAIGNLVYTDLNDAIVKGNELGIAPTVNSDLVEAQKVTTAGLVKTNGFYIPLTSDSLGAKISYDENGKPETYEFDSKYNDSTATYKWYIGNPHNENQIKSDDYYIVETLRLGHMPTYKGEKLGYANYKEGQTFYVASCKTGWATTYGMNVAAEELVPVSEEDVGKTISLYTTYTSYNKITYKYIILDKNGLYQRGHSTASFYGSDWYNATSRNDSYGINRSVNLQYGETFVLCNDVTVVGNFGASRVNNGNAKTYGFDLNGYTMTINSTLNDKGKNPAIFQTKTGETMSFYSSVAGGTVKLHGFKEDAATNLSGGTLFQFYGSGSNEISDNINPDSNNNTHLNVGKVTVFGNTYSGSNLTIYGDMLARVENGDATCTVNFDGITFIKHIHKEGAVFESKRFNGDINVKNSNFFIPNGGTFLNGTNHGISDTNGDGKLDKYDVAEFDSKGMFVKFRDDAIRVAADVVIDGCYIFVRDNGGSTDYTNLSSGDYSFGSVLYTNTVTNGRIGGSNVGGAIKIGENCCVLTPSATKADGITARYWYQDMQIGNTGLKTITVQYVSGFTKGNNNTSSVKYEYADWTFAVQGSTGDTVLPNFTFKHVSDANTATVTFKDVNGDVIDSKVYAIGGNIQTPAVSDHVAGDVITLKFNGTFSNMPEGTVAEDVVITANYDKIANMTGIKANLSLYSDFVINVYIPESYLGSIVNVNGIDLPETTVEIEGAKYYKVTVDKLAKDATTDATFVINVAEGGFTAEAKVTLSIAKYAETILGGSYTDADKILMYYMLNYANEAAKYFETNNTAIENLLNANSDYAINSGSEYNYDGAIEDAKDIFASAFNYATVRLEEAPAFVLNIKEGFVGTVTVTYGQGNVRTFEIKTAGDAEDLVVDGMKIFNFGTTLTITAEGTIGETAVNVSGTYNLDTFAKYHTDVVNGVITENVTDEMKANSEAALDLIEALYDYVEIAEQYKAKTLVMPKTPDAGETESPEAEA